MTKKSAEKTVEIDGEIFSLENASEEVQAQLSNLKFVDLRLQQLNNEMAISDTARIGYLNALKQQLPKVDGSEDWGLGQKFEFNDKTYDVETLGDKAKALIESLNFTNQRSQELLDIQSLLERARGSYIRSLKSEIISNKAGVLFGEEWREENMPKITVDGVEYNSEDLTDNGKAQLASLQFLEVQMSKIKGEIAVYQTARAQYIVALKKALETTEEVNGTS